jgi:Ca2+-binding EF-hand superfamily protein
VQQKGSISTTVLRGILAAIDDKLTDADLDAAIDEIDEDGSGTVDFDGASLYINCIHNSHSVFTEFKQMMNG